MRTIRIGTLRTPTANQKAIRPHTPPSLSPKRRARKNPSNRTKASVNTDMHTLPISPEGSNTYDHPRACSCHLNG